MSNSTCIVCDQSTGKRICKINDLKLICEQCCWQIKYKDCAGCQHYREDSARRIDQRRNVSKSPAITVPIDQQVEETIDQILRLINSGDLDRSKQLIDTLAENHSDYHSVNYVKGVLLLKQNQVETGIEYLEKAVEQNPLLVQAYYNLAVAYRDRNDFVNMIKNYRMVVDLDQPGSLIAKESKKFLSRLQKEIFACHNVNLDCYLQARDCFNTGFKYLKKQQPEKAIPKFIESIKLVTNLPQSHGNLGLCYAQQGNRKEALAAFDRALEIDPKYDAARNNKSIVECLREGEKLKLLKVPDAGAKADDKDDLKQKSIFGGLIRRLFR